MGYRVRAETALGLCLKEGGCYPSALGTKKGGQQGGSTGLTLAQDQDGTRSKFPEAVQEHTSCAQG